VDGLIEAARYGLSGGDRATLEFAAPVREQAIVALGKLGAEAGDGAVIEALRDPSDRVRAAAVRVLDARQEAEPLVEALGWLPARRGQSRRLAVRAVLELCTPGNAKAVARVLVHRTDDEPLGEEDAALVLTLVAGDKRPGAANELVDEVVAALAHERDVIADRAEELLVKLAPTSTEAVIAALEAGAAPHRAASVLAAVNDTRALVPLVRALGDRDPRVRTESAAALGELRDPAALGPLLRAARDPEHRVRVQAGRALDRVGAAAVASDASLLVRPMVLDALRSAATQRARHGAPYEGKGNVPALTAAGFPQPVDAAKLRNIVAFLDRLNDTGR
jgi:HEAT repeat protein